MIKPFQNLIDGKQENIFSTNESDIFTLPPLGSTENKTAEVSFMHIPIF